MKRHLGFGGKAERSADGEDAAAPGGHIAACSPSSGDGTQLGQKRPPLPGTDGKKAPTCAALGCGMGPISGHSAPLLSHPSHWSTAALSPCWATQSLSCAQKRAAPPTYTVLSTDPSSASPLPHSSLQALPLCAPQTLQLCGLPRSPQRTANTASPKCYRSPGDAPSLHHSSAHSALSSPRSLCPSDQTEHEHTIGSYPPLCYLQPAADPSPGTPL